MKNENNNDINKKEDILLAAERVFAERGFKGTTIREVARQAGVANSLIFYYFENKDVMYDAVFQHVFSQLEALIQQNLDMELDHLSKLKRVIFSCVDLGSKHRNLLKMMTRELIDNGSVAEKLNQKFFVPLYNVADEFFEKGKKEAYFRDVDTLHFLHSMMGMLAFYFITDPLFQSVDIEDPYGPEETEKRKHEVWDVIRSSLI